ncbi:MAG: N-carbamoylputrescine amidase, partial [Myxococcaceae bacterium]|nr:N-carbamoylputrescine amidase [Myxococcaceae bacterium]
MSVRVAALQCALGGSYEQNVARIEQLVREAHEQGAQIVLPPELFAGTYFCRHEEHTYFGWAETFEDSKTIARFA